ncbi:hypothetical protein [Clostridium ganghwense]|uniref:Uncharacterized protein n=1 Tax=Clostridium ganghwense TaxID=312089 RepID=A0ABT4CU28_9CLOT|nr:hypothetical protein [Clostridium ganghwense]MCY6372575.1 hypothetical protein [Clostridium ganghwense]
MKISFFYKRKDGYIISNETNCTEEADKNTKTIKKIAEHIEKQCEEYRDEIDFSEDNEELKKLLKAFKEELKNREKI